MSSNLRTSTPAWAALEEHCTALKGTHLKTLFAQDHKRFDHLHARCDHVLYDYSKQKITEETIEKLCALASAAGLPEKREALFNGAQLNTTEKRAALHPALRGAVDKTLTIKGETISAFVTALQEKIKTIAENLRNDPTITDVIHIGVGGSDLGPRLVCQALDKYQSGPHVHFIKNIDGQSVNTLLSKLKPEKTAVLIASKTFTTLETMQAARWVKIWLEKALDQSTLGTRLFAITSALEKAQEFGVQPDHILPMRDWIGGRFSLWSGIGLPIAVALGYDIFETLLTGAAKADAHFKEAPLTQNIPVLMAMIGIWNRNFMNYPAHAVLPYADSLALLPAYMQQLDMESNGKDAGALKTAPIIFGGTGTCAQHAFMQALHQSQEVTPCDFIIIARNPEAPDDFQQALNANALAQAQALMRGSENAQEPHRHFPGDRPSSSFILPQLSPDYLGMLLAFYEHKIFVQGIIWGINSFDQWGVELGKTLAKDITQDLQSGAPCPSHDSSTAGLIRMIVEQDKLG